jgi:haloacetate dehalogenase
MTGTTDIERRALLTAITAVSGAALSSAILSRHAAAQLAESTPVASDAFEAAEIETGENTIFVRSYGKGSPLLMVHGFPRTSLMWRNVAPQLASNYTVICVDLRGYGRSGVPASAEDHYPYTKRAMAAELVAVSEDSLARSRSHAVGYRAGAGRGRRPRSGGRYGNLKSDGVLHG